MPKKLITLKNVKSKKTGIFSNCPSFVTKNRINKKIQL